MKRLFQPLAVAALGLALFSCDKGNEPVNRTNGGELLGEPTRFEMSSSLGAVGIESLSSNTDKAEESLRASLHFKGLSQVAKTTLDASKFGAGKLNARWGVVYDGGQKTGENCPSSVSAEPENPNDLEHSTVYFKNTATTSIAGGKVKMYSVSQGTLTNITKGIMLLDGKDEAQTKQYFMKDKCDPNERIAGLLENEQQDDRHIPIMTDLVDFADIKAGSGNNPTFAPRGSLIGLNIKNRTGEKMIVTGIVVYKNDDSAFDYSGYFDWANVGSDNKAVFHSEYAAAQETESALVFPVYKGQTATYEIADGNDAADIPCFYVWAFQKATLKGKPFPVQVRYKVTADGEEQTTRTFKVYAPDSKVNTGEKMFDDGYVYNTVLTIDPSNNTGGSVGSDWGDGGVQGNFRDNVVNPLSLVAKYDIAKVANTAGTDHTLQFVTNHNVKTDAGAYVTDYTQFQEGVDVGIYTWAEAMRLFGYKVADNTAPVFDINKTNEDGFNGQHVKAGLGQDKFEQDNGAGKFKARKYKTIAGQDYYLPNSRELYSIAPPYLSTEDSKALQDKNPKKFLHILTFNNDWATVRTDPVRRLGKVAGKLGLSDVQIGNDILLATDYDDEYLTKEVGVGSGNFVTYVIRFKGTKYESAWRYEYKTGDASNGGSRLIIKNVMLWQNSGKSLVNDIAKESFFEKNSSVERIFPAYGFIPKRFNALDENNPSINSTLLVSGIYGTITSRSAKNFSHGTIAFNNKDVRVSNYFRFDGRNIRPWKRN